MKDSKNFFSDVEREKITDSIRKVEKRTSGEIVVCVAKSSGSYFYADVIIGLFLTIILSWSAVYLFPSAVSLFAGDAALKGLINLPFETKDELRYIALYGLYIFIPAFLILIAPAIYISSKICFLKRVVAGKERIEREVRDKALLLFYKHGLWKTRDNTGIIILFSLLERRVYILADKGIYEKITQSKLDEYAQSMSKGIKEGKAFNATVQTIESLGSVLEENFPIKKDDTNELSDAVIIE